MSPSVRSSGAEFVRGYFRFLKRWCIGILLLFSTALAALAVYDYFFPQARVYERFFRQQPLSSSIKPK